MSPRLPFQYIGRKSEGTTALLSLSVFIIGSGDGITWDISHTHGTKNKNRLLKSNKSLLIILKKSKLNL